MVADDDLDDQELMSEALSQLNNSIDIIQLTDGMQVIDYMLKCMKSEEKIPDLIFLDLNMPLMDGFEVLKELKKYSSLSAIPIYVITVSRRKEDYIKAIQLGAMGFYSKGSHASAIFKIIKEIYEKNTGLKEKIAEN